MEAIGLAAKGIVLEPVSRNTGPSAAIAALIAAQEGADVLVLLAPSDHMIGDAGAFALAIETGVPAAEAGALVVFGIEPDCRIRATAISRPSLATARASKSGASSRSRRWKRPNASSTKAASYGTPGCFCFRRTPCSA
jgi:hypothetical protein